MNIPLEVQVLGWGILSAASVYVILSMLAVLIWERHRKRASAEPPLASPPAVSVLKPLCGLEPRLYENLRSFCLQDHPRFQLLFGVRDANDPALDVVRRLQAEFPQVDSVIVADARIHGSNLKVSNLMNLLPRAKHDWLVIADSDIAAAPDYLKRVVRPLARADVGVVTCLYRGHALGGFWAQLGKQFIDDWFAPSVLLVRLFGSTSFGFGATLALRRETLDAIGGLQALVTHLADDYQLAALARAHGLRTVLSPCAVATDVAETRARELVAHELRWLRTIRMIQPLGYVFSFVTFTLPVATIGYLMTGAGATAGLLLALAFLARLGLHYLQLEPGERIDSPRSVSGLCSDLVLFWVRDSLSLCLWMAAFFGRRVSWRGQMLATGSNGYTASIAPLAKPVQPSMGSDSPEVFQ